MTAITLASGAVTGLGVLLILRGLCPPRPALARLIAPAPLRPARPPASGWVKRIGAPLAPLLTAVGLPTPALRRDLALLERDIHGFLAEKVVGALALMLFFPAFPAAAMLAGVNVPPILAFWVAVLGGVFGFFLADMAVRSEAAKLRTDFRHALSAFLDLTVAGLAGGSGVDGALSDAAAIGTGQGFTHIRRALDAARLTQQPAWETLGQLGARLGISELTELAASVSLAEGEGAKVRTSLSAKAATLRAHQLAEIESAATAATERMSLPLVVMFAGLLVFLGTPALLTFMSAFE
jgi:tight adherence protein C